MVGRRVGLAVIGTVLASEVIGCGASRPKPDPVRLSRLIAQANTRCGRHRPVRQAELDVIEKAAGYLPAGREIAKAHAQRRALETELGKLSSKGRFVPNSADFIG